MSRFQPLRATFSVQTMGRSAAVALFVGTVLNMINQGDVLSSGSPLVWWKVLLNYFVPFAVATYGSYAALREVSKGPGVTGQ